LTADDIMRKIIKNILLSVLILVGCAVLTCGILAFSMFMGIKSAYNSIRPLKLTEISDGVYNGSAGSFIITADLDVTVENHRITNIKINRQVCSSSHRALDTITFIMDRQEANVDAVSGATWTSRSLMAATYDALQND
jgi:uncharacterized protein with FMN-binding domain